MDVDGYRIVPVPTVHSLHVRSFGFVVEKRGRSFFYSSDMVAVEERYHRRLRGVQVVITDGSHIRSGGLVRIDRASGERYGHAGIPDLVRFFRRRADRIVITHYGSWFYKDVEASIGRIEALGNRVRVIAAYDGLTLEV
jgi:phosphoribosyl 1,2-cyclic phosphodiesterase